MRKDPNYYIDGVRAADRVLLARTITLIESSLPSHQELAAEIIERLLPHTGKAIRLGITGVPGAGKSTFIDSFGTMLTEDSHRVAVLAIDPSSTRSGGSILGDKTRMLRLGIDKNAFIRPSPSGGTLGGVARKTRETMLVCEAAGFDFIIIETVGVGQSETTVASMVDFFLVLMIAGAGDELQGIKKGILEVADGVVINKADGDNIKAAERAAQEYGAALHLLTPDSPHWSVPVLTCSATQKSGLENILKTVTRHRTIMQDRGELEKKRKKQDLAWMSFLIEDGLHTWFHTHPEVNRLLPELRDAVQTQRISPTAAAARLLQYVTGSSG